METWSQNIQQYLTVTNFPNLFRLVDMVAELGMSVFVNFTIIGSDNGLSPNSSQIIIWTNADILSIGPPETHVLLSTTFLLLQKWFGNVHVYFPRFLYWNESKNCESIVNEMLSKLCHKCAFKLCNT